MKNYKLLFCSFFIGVIGFSFSQQATHCPKQLLSLKINNSSDVPTTSNNSDGTITLTFAQQNLTDLFANHSVYDFYQTYPNSSSNEVLKYYSIVYTSKALIEDLLTNVPTSIFENISSEDVGTYVLPLKTAISSDLIEALDGETYDVIKYLSVSDSDPCVFYESCTPIDVPNDFTFRVTFNYNAQNDLLNMETEGLTPCGNAISLLLSGGNPIDPLTDINTSLQLWETSLGTSNITDFNMPCHAIESIIYSIIGVACFNHNLGNISVTIDSNTEDVQFYRSNMVFGYDIVEFSKANLSLSEETFTKLKPFKTKDNPYLQVLNFKQQPLTIDIYNTLGQKIYTTPKFEGNTINLSNFQNGLYFIKLSTLKNQHKVFKFLLN